MLLLSDGFLDGFDQKLKALEHGLDQNKQKEPKDLLNELVYKIKSKFTDSDDLPAQDCTALVLDVKAQMYALNPKATHLNKNKKKM